MAKNFPDILAVDPTGCGCTECIIGEYVNEDVWMGSANAEDLIAFARGDVGNNTSRSELDIPQSYNFSKLSAQLFAEKLLEMLNNELPSLNYSEFEQAYTDFPD